jgi:hypothetical protein
MRDLAGDGQVRAIRKPVRTLVEPPEGGRRAQREQDQGRGLAPAVVLDGASSPSSARGASDVAGPPRTLGPQMPRLGGTAVDGFGSGVCQYHLAGAPQSRRLSVRTPVPQTGRTGSIPVGTTMHEPEALGADAAPNRVARGSIPLSGAAPLRGRPAPLRKERWVGGMEGDAGSKLGGALRQRSQSLGILEVAPHSQREREGEGRCE